MIGMALPPPIARIARVVPFLVAGLIAGRVSYVGSRRARIIATASLAIAASVGWTAFTFGTSDLSIAKTVALLGASLPVMCVASLWAYFGMFLVNRGRSAPSVDDVQQDAELDDLERELRDEIQREQNQGTGSDLGGRA
jgi:hypothetical protein